MGGAFGCCPKTRHALGWLELSRAYLLCLKVCRWGSTSGMVSDWEVHSGVVPKLAMPAVGQYCGERLALPQGLSSLVPCPGS